MHIQLVFCADGVLRVRHSIREPLVPLTSYQEFTGQSDLVFMPKWWDEGVIFEDGLTIAKFLNCLAPWSDFWSAITSVDVDAYIAESKKPYLPTEEDQGKKWYAVLQYFTKISQEHKSNKHLDDFDGDLNAYFADRTPSTPMPFWDCNGHYVLNGHVEGVVEHYGIHHTPINELANYPLILGQHHIIHEESRHDNGDSLFNDAVIRSASHPDKTYSYVYHYVVGEKYHKLRNIVEAFFDDFSPTPEARDGFNEYLKDMVAEVQTELEMDHTVEDASHDTLTETACDGALKIKDDDSEFSNTKQFERETEFFKSVLDHAISSSAALKIGSVNKQVMPEKRISLYLVDDADLYAVDEDDTV